jgi:radical SAM protein with 4Fe4S-binding SPASM domain
MVGDDDGGETCIGTVFNGFDETRRDALLEPLDLSRIGCNECVVRPRCTNFCRAVNHATTGSALRPGEVVCFHERMSAQVADRAGGMLISEGNLASVERFGGF